MLTKRESRKSRHQQRDTKPRGCRRLQGIRAADLAVPHFMKRTVT